MKKLIFVFIALFMLTIISGCGARQSTIRYNNGNDSVKNSITEEEVSVEDDSEEVDTEETAIESEVVKIASATGKLAVTSFDGAFLKTNLSYNVVKGTVSSDTHKITINDYQLTKYLPGQTQWDYIASTRFSTLKSGLNTYVVKTFDSKGNQKNSLIFSIDYNALVVPAALPDVGVSHWPALIIAFLIIGAYTIFRKIRCL